MKKRIKLTKNDLYNIITESVNKILMEKFDSSKLKHAVDNGKLLTNERVPIDLKNIKDEDVVGVFDWFELKGMNGYELNNFASQHGVNINDDDDLCVKLKLQNGQYLLLVNRGINSGNNEYLAKTKERRDNKPYLQNKTYKWSNKNASEIFHNPWFKEKKNNVNYINWVK